MCDFSLEHPSISRFHAGDDLIADLKSVKAFKFGLRSFNFCFCCDFPVIQYKRSGVAYLFDLGSTHGTIVNKTKVFICGFHNVHFLDPAL